MNWREAIGLRQPGVPIAAEGCPRPRTQLIRAWPFWFSPERDFIAVIRYPMNHPDDDSRACRPIAPFGIGLAPWRLNGGVRRREAGKVMEGGVLRRIGSDPRNASSLWRSCYRSKWAQSASFGTSSRTISGACADIFPLSSDQMT